MRNDRTRTSHENQFCESRTRSIFSLAVALVTPLRAQFAYVANGNGNTVSGYNIDRKTGTLTPVPGSPFATGLNPFSVALDPTGQFAYVANRNSNTVSGYSIDRKTEALTPVPGSPFAMGPFPCQ
jgi:DNA-binding beta-propeller fold protein YncE